MLTTGIYYVILGIMRFAVVCTRRKPRAIQRFAGIMLMCMAIPLMGTVVLATMKDRGIKYHEIVMITIALYTFTKMTLATINLVKSRKGNSKIMMTLRNILFADGFVSVFSLQRSMLVSFEGMTQWGIRIMNIATGTAVCIVVFLLGVSLLRRSQK